ncbi:ethanolamine ammonia-lyase light chain EutC [Methylomonas albis]|uniref:ethanolamine ammonia-lyase light chain EutC n=1 Tax=Methylomonas albis TaxID=1854563 RepID=UPI001CE08BD4|nr:ethanolamine ammonia-lyase light chain EutC [Methylomonas albis]
MQPADCSAIGFQLAHAAAQDAVHQAWDVAAFAEGLETTDFESLVLATPVASRAQYRQSPDWGRCLTPPAGNTDDQRNCISNIRPPTGQSYGAASSKLVYPSEQALIRGLSGIAPKDDMLEQRRGSNDLVIAAD